MKKEKQFKLEKEKRWFFWATKNWNENEKQEIQREPHSMVEVSERFQWLRKEN